MPVPGNPTRRRQATARELAKRWQKSVNLRPRRQVAEVSGMPGTRGAAVGAGEGVQVHALSAAFLCPVLRGVVRPARRTADHPS